MKLFLFTLLFLFPMSSPSVYAQPGNPRNDYAVPDSSQLISESPTCEDIKYVHDKLTGISAYNSPASEIGKLNSSNSVIAAINISKRITGSDTLFQLGIVGTSGNYESELQGVIIILENGYKLDAPDLNFSLIQATNVTYFYFGSFILSEEMRELLNDNKISALVLFAYTPHAANDFVVPEDEAKNLRFYLNCLMSDI